MTTSSASNMESHVWTKPQTQKAIKALRNSGLVVDKLSAGYECKIKDTVVFKAMIGTRGYLVRYDQSLFITK